VNLLVVGASHRTAPVAVLEQLAVAPGQTRQILGRLLAQPYVGEAVVLSTCNRVEVYAGVTAFHGGLADVCGVLAEHAGCAQASLAGHLYVYYDGAAVDHAYRVATGLDSLVVGEAQILGQLREAYHAATEVDTVGRLLHELMQQALRVGKRAHAETELDRAGQSVVTAALDVAARALAPRTFPESAGQAGPSTGIFPENADGNADGRSVFAGRPALVIGAGSMGALAVATLSRAGAAPLSVANRGGGRAARLAEAYEAAPVQFDDVTTVLSTVDVVVAATASPEPVLTARTVADALARRRPDAGPLVILDLAVPRDVEPAVADLPGVRLVDIDGLADALDTPPHWKALAGVDSDKLHLPEAVTAAEQIVTAEVESFLGWLRGAEVAPTVAALRARADDLVATELRRLAQRRPDLTDDQRAEVAHAIHRVVQRLLHSPTVRVRQLATEPGGDQYAALLRELFDLEVPQPRQAGEVTDIGVDS
jgi:glutamyl-tRNA reductase